MVHKAINSLLFVILVNASFAQGNFMFNQHGFLSTEIDTGTYINFIIETSSLSKDSIQMAMNTDLKDSLIQFYGTDTLYNDRVTVNTASTERIFSTDYLGMGITSISVSNNIKIVNMVFEDEVANSYYNVPFDSNYRSSAYETDITEIRTNTEDWRGTLRYTGVVFWVDKGYYDLDLFLDAVYNGIDAYSGNYGLSDRQEQFVFYYGENDKMVSDSETRGYYTGKILEALRDLGFDL